MTIKSQYLESIEDVQAARTVQLKTLRKVHPRAAAGSHKIQRDWAPSPALQTQPGSRVLRLAAPPGGSDEPAEAQELEFDFLCLLAS